MAATVPVSAVRLAERAQFVKDHPGWTFGDYDNAAAGDIAFQREYELMLRAAERKALDDATQKAQADAEQTDA